MPSLISWSPPIAAQTHEPVDAVFVTVKIPDNESAVAEIMPLLKSNTAVITFQNGIESPELLDTTGRPRPCRRRCCLYQRGYRRTWRSYATAAR